jgi:hypothetical protein
MRGSGKVKRAARERWPGRTRFAVVAAQGARGAGQGQRDDQRDAERTKSMLFAAYAA